MRHDNIQTPSARSATVVRWLLTIAACVAFGSCGAKDSTQSKSEDVAFEDELLKRFNEQKRNNLAEERALQKEAQDKLTEPDTHDTLEDARAKSKESAGLNEAIQECLNKLNPIQAPTDPNAYQDQQDLLAKCRDAAEKAKADSESTADAADDKAASDFEKFVAAALRIAALVALADGNYELAYILLDLANHMEQGGGGQGGEDQHNEAPRESDSDVPEGYQVLSRDKTGEYQVAINSNFSKILVIRDDIITDFEIAREDRSKLSDKSIPDCKNIFVEVGLSVSGVLLQQGAGGSNCPNVYVKRAHPLDPQAEVQSVGPGDIITIEPESGN